MELLLSELKVQALEVYISFGPENSRPWECLLFSDRETTGPGSVYYVRNWKYKAMEVVKVHVDHRTCM